LFLPNLKIKEILKMGIYLVKWDRDDDAYIHEPKYNSAPDDYAYIEADSPEEAIEIAKSNYNISSRRMWYPDLNSFIAEEKQLEELTKKINSIEYYYTKDLQKIPLIPSNLYVMLNAINVYIQKREEEINYYSDKARALKEFEELEDLIYLKNKIKKIHFKIEKNNKEQNELEEKINEDKEDFQLKQLKEKLIKLEELKNIYIEELKTILKLML
jgi:hypothetical protein